MYILVLFVVCREDYTRLHDFVNEKKIRIKNKGKVMNTHTHTAHTHTHTHTHTHSSFRHVRTVG